MDCGIRRAIHKVSWVGGSARCYQVAIPDERNFAAILLSVSIVIVITLEPKMRVKADELESVVETILAQHFVHVTHKCVEAVKVVGPAPRCDDQRRLVARLTASSWRGKRMQLAQDAFTQRVSLASSSVDEAQRSRPFGDRSCPRAERQTYDEPLEPKSCRRQRLETSRERPHAALMRL